MGKEERKEFGALENSFSYMWFLVGGGFLFFSMLG